MPGDNCFDKEFCDVKHGANDKEHASICDKTNLRFDAINEYIRLRGEIYEQRFDSMDSALVLRTGAIDARLHALNDWKTLSMNEIAKSREDFVRKDVWEPRHRDLTDWQALVNNDLSIIKTRAVTWTAAISAFTIIINFALIILLHMWGGK